MEAENYLSGGYGIRLALEAKKAGWVRLVEMAHIWQPNRLKGIQVTPEYGNPFLAATQVFDLRPIPRKFLSLDRTHNASDRFVKAGTILVTCSGNVGRSTLAHRAHEGILISHDLLRVEPRRPETWGWIYAVLRCQQGRAMMAAAQYGHIIKHLEVPHLNALPIPAIRDGLLPEFDSQARAILAARNEAFECLAAAEIAFERCVGTLAATETGESGFSIRASSLFERRRRFEAFFHNPMPAAIRRHFLTMGLKTSTLEESGFDVWLPTRFRRIPAEAGVEFMDSSDLFEVSPDITKRIADRNLGDPFDGRVKAGWLLLARSGQIYGLNGSLILANEYHEGRIISDHIMRIAPTPSRTMRPGYIYVALSHPSLGRPLVKSLAYGSSIPEIDPTDMKKIEVVRLAPRFEDEIADLAERGSGLLAKADEMERGLALTAEDFVDRFLAGDHSDFVIT